MSTKLQRLETPAISTDCNFIEGENLEQMAANLAKTLREVKPI